MVQRLPVRAVEGVDVRAVRYGRLSARVYRPRTDAALLWIHGGRFILGDAR